METLNRCDTKWAHPEYVEENIYTAPGSATFLVEDHTVEEYIDYRKGFYEPVLEVYESGLTPEAKARGAWKSYVTEHGCPEEPEATVRLEVWTPNDIKEGEKLPVIFYVVGGGLISGGTCELAKFGLIRVFNANVVRAVFIIFEYRIAAQGKYPAAINDCHAAYQWMIEHAEEQHIDTDRILVWGTSTGGHFTLSLMFRLKRYNWCGAPMPRGIIPEEPPMDDIGYGNSNQISFQNGDEVDMIDSRAIRNIYKVWLGEQYANPALPPEAVPNRATVDDIRGGFPPTWFTSELEFDDGRDSVYDFAARLHEAGVFCDLHVWGGGTHQSTGGTETDVAKRMNLVVFGAIRDALTYDFRRPWLTEKEKTYNRCDTKWAHPESAAEGCYTGIRKTKGVSDPETTDEGRKYGWKTYETDAGCPEEPEAKVTLLMAAPKDIQKSETLPAILCFIKAEQPAAGILQRDILSGLKLAEESRQRAVLAFVSCRTVPENPYPAAIHDAHTAYLWIMEHARELQIDKEKVVFWGVGFGGQTALSAAFHLKDCQWCGYPMPRGIIAQVPVMDDSALNQSQKFSFRDKDGTMLALDAQAARQDFRLLLGDMYGNFDLPAKAVPARAVTADMRGYPPVWFPSVAEFDGARDSIYKFARHLHEAGVYCDLHEWGGTSHQFTAGEQTDFSVRCQTIAAGALRDALTYDFRRPWLKTEI